MWLHGQLLQARSHIRSEKLYSMLWCSFQTSYAHEMPPSVANMYGCCIVAFALQGITSSGVFAAKAMPISNFENPGKVPYYVTGPTKIN